VKGKGGRDKMGKERDKKGREDEPLPYLTFLVTPLL